MGQEIKKSFHFSDYWQHCSTANLKIVRHTEMSCIGADTRHAHHATRHAYHATRHAHHATRHAYHAARHAHHARHAYHADTRHAYHATMVRGKVSF